jgi:hypothetical protein
MQFFSIPPAVAAEIQIHRAVGVDAVSCTKGQYRSGQQLLENGRVGGSEASSVYRV